MALYTDDTVHSVIEKINEKYFLPDIQRPFVWKQDQIYALFDSIMRGYPINTFLFWKVSSSYMKETNIKKFKFICNNKEENLEDTNFQESEYYLVLDGQQRITSLNIALKGFYMEKRKKKVLFLNVHSGKEEDDEGVLYEFKFLDNVGDDFFLDKEKLWVNVKAIYECKDISQRRVLREKVTKLTTEKDLVEENIETLHSRLRGEEILNYYTEKEKEYDRVLDIFVRTNSGGTKLTYSDLLFSTIKLRWREARDNFSNLINDINGEVFDFDTDFILKTCFTIFAKSQKDIKYSKKNVDDENKIQEIIQNWEKIVDAISITRDLITRFGIVHSKLLTSNNALIPLAYYIYKNDIKGFGDSKQKNILSKEDESSMKSLLISSLLTGLFGGQSDTILYSIKEEIDKSKNNRFPFAEIKSNMSKKNKDLTLTEEFLDSVEYKDKNSYLILNLIYSNINYNPNSKNNLPEQDHLFSRKELKSEGFSETNINSIFNIRYIPSTSNKKKTGTSFKDWVKTLSPNEKKEHLIPEGNWDVDKYQEFLEERKKLISNKIKESFNN